MRLLAVALLALSLPAAAAEAGPVTARTPAMANEKANEKAPLTPREQRVLRLLELTGAANVGLQMADALFAQFQNDPSVPKEFLARFRQRMDPDALTRLVIPVYTRHLSEEDVEAAIRFYETPTGRRVIGAMPQMVQEAMALGQQWAVQQAQAVLAELPQEADEDMEVEISTPPALPAKAAPAKSAPAKK